MAAGLIPLPPSRVGFFIGGFTMQAPSPTYGMSEKITPEGIIRAVSAPRVSIDLYSHGIRVSRFDSEIRTALISHCVRDLSEEGLERLPGGRFRQVIMRVFTGTNKQRSFFHFHRNQLPQILKLLDRAGVSPHRIEQIEHALYEPTKVEFPLVDARPPRESQVGIIDYLMQPTDPRYAPSKVVPLQTGGGKAQPLDAAIRVPGGWSTMGEMSVGSQVIAKDGSITEVTGVYPQGKKEIFRVTFADGRSTECCAEHLWKVFFVNTAPHRRWRVVNTLEMIRMLAMPNPRVYIDLPDSEAQEDIELPLDPYILGLLLGDGHIGKGVLNFSSEDAFLINEIRQALPAGLTLQHSDRCNYRIVGDRNSRPNAWIDIMRELELTGKLSHSKAVPESYMNGSHRQRLALIQGLMDSDGTVGKDNGAVSFCTVSPFLAQQFQYLIRSVGGIATMGQRTPSYTYGGEKRLGRQAFVISVRHKVPSSLMRLPRKRDLCRDDGQYTEGLKLRVTSIESIGEKEAQCISIDHPERLYVTDDFIVTHNTYIALHTFRKMGVRSVLVVPGKYIEKWIEDVEGAYGKRKKKLMTVRGMPQLRSLMNIALAGELVADFIIISSKTMAMYLQHYERYGVDDLCPVAPMDFYKVIGAGVRLIDEVHEQFHCNFRQDLYAHLPLTVSLSATLEPDSRFLRRMYETVWPPGTWAPVPAHHCYIAVHALWYRFKSLLGLKWTNFLRQYNHTELEKSIMRKKLVLENYVDMITGIVGDAYVSKREPGQKMIVFVATVSMATIVRDQLASTFRNLVVNRYISEDEYANLHSGDIVVSTLLSAGTAVDIANLRVTLMTTALSSKQSNLQVLGRTRPLKDWPDVTPEFYFLSCSDIEKHALYTKEKREKFEGKILSFSERPTGYVV